MSFDIVLSTCNLGNKTEERTNPFTGDTVRVHVDEHATEAERTAIIRLLESLGAKSIDEPGGYAINLPEGELIELHLDDGFGSGGIGLHDLSRGVCDFLHSLADVGNYALTPIVNESVTVVTSKERAMQVKTRWPDVQAVGSGADIELMLEHGVAQWKSFRDQVTQD